MCTMGVVYIKFNAPKLRNEVSNMAEMGKASTRAKNKYNAENYDNLRIVVPKGKKEKIKAYAESKGESINGFVNRAIDEAMENEGEDK